VFHLGYVWRELRRRLGRTILTAAGLAIGVGLVLGIIGVSNGLSDAQDDVLRPLQSVGTDILVTRVAGATTTGTGAGATSTTQPAQQQDRRAGGGGFFGGRPGAGGLNQQDTAALLAENRNVVTDLASLGKPGAKFTRDFFLSGTLLSFPDTAVRDIAEVPGVTAATGGLVQLAQHETGTVPQIVASIRTGGETTTQTVRPAPMTDAERQAFRDCLQSKGVTFGGGGGAGTGGTPGDGGGSRGGGARSNPAFEDCLPPRFQQFQATFTTPLRTIQQVVDPPTTDITTKSYTAAGIDPAEPQTGLVTKAQLVDGRWLATGAKKQVLLSAAYANTNGMEVGSTLPINGSSYEVVGIVNPTLTGSTADVYFSLSQLQSLAEKPSRITQVLVKAASSADVDAVAARIEKVVPGAEVVTTKALADEVSGSLADAGRLVDRLGGVLAVIVLIGASAIAALLTLSSVAKRVREIGTLRAIGWSKRRVIGQLLGETFGISVLGGALGILVGVAACAAISALAPSLSATSSGVPGVASSSLASFFNQTQAAAHTTTVALHAPLHLSTLLAGFGFAVLGGLLAGLAGSWRAARLAPVVSLRDLG
jgi:ABC-type antimicrobial peptide transport system permease subunit